MNIRTGSFLLVSFFGTLVSIGCSSDPEPDKYPTTDAFCKALVEAECGAVAGKCGVTSDACGTVRLASCNGLVAAATGPGIRKYSSGGAQACIDKSKAVLAQEKVVPTDIAAVNDVCNKVFRGAIEKDKGTCTTKYDCSGDLTCDQGVCVSKIEKPRDGYCADPGAVCPSDQYCGTNAQGKQQCLNRKKKTEACDAQNLCLSNLRCLNAACADKGKAGEGCVTDDDCDPAVPLCDVDPKIGSSCIDARRYTKGATACTAYGAATTP